MNKERIFTSKVFVNQEMRDAINDVFDSGIFSNGEKAREFEKKFAEYCGVKHAIAVSNGTVAIELVLRSLGIKEGDEVIVPSHTTMPTVEPVLAVGATPVFAEISEESYILNPAEIEKLITGKTKALIVVHIYGNSGDLDSLKKICDTHGIFLIEDCAQAHGTRYGGKQVGSFGAAGCFSFYPTKNMTVCGEGGMIITNDDRIAKMSSMLRNHGEEGRYNHVLPASNYRLSEIHCAIGTKQLELLEDFIEKRRKIAKIYDDAFRNNRRIIIPSENKNSRHSYHLYVIRVPCEKRKKIIDEMGMENIFLGIHYPTPVHLQPAIKKIMAVPKLEITEKISGEILSLPIYPLLEEQDAAMIAEKINYFLND
ncbi:DegT/DnrJ/EryC1/StrS family aminotransferase [Candidatus Pacearchaeota archaeon]|nr:DegT/DnrJ/EryC1/StrS family aminotransferase [Candidatus Pacearchaeota archaeon]